jgi:hypothetical protein
LFCRRNLNPNQITYLTGKRFETEKKLKGAPIGNRNAEKQTAQNGPLNGDTAQRIWGCTCHNFKKRNVAKMKPLPKKRTGEKERREATEN